MKKRTEVFPEGLSFDDRPVTEVLQKFKDETARISSTEADIDSLTKEVDDLLHSADGEPKDVADLIGKKNVLLGVYRMRLKTFEENLAAVTKQLYDETVRLHQFIGMLADASVKPMEQALKKILLPHFALEWEADDLIAKLWSLRSIKCLYVVSRPDPSCRNLLYAVESGLALLNEYREFGMFTPFSDVGDADKAAAWRKAIQASAVE